MTKCKFYVAGAIGLALCVAQPVSAQLRAVPRGSVKVQPRFFNPFDVSSRFTLSPFGTFSTTALQPTAPLAMTSTTSTTTTTSTDTSGGGGGSESLSLIVVPTAAPPPFNPPVRSPFRPPPRAPFIP